jgi:hypothetical protein
VDRGGRAVVEAEIPRSEIDFYASRLLSVGTDARIESPAELVWAMCEKALEVAHLYDRDYQQGTEGITHQTSKDEHTTPEGTSS